MRLSTLLAVPALALASQSVHAQEGTAPTQQDIERASMIAAKSDLRNLVTAQEAYFADHSAYGTDLDGLRFRPSQNVTIRFTATQNNGWAAEARHALLPNVACVIWVNLAEKNRPKVGGKLLPQAEGEPACGLIEEKK